MVFKHPLVILLLGIQVRDGSPRQNLQLLHAAAWEKKKSACPHGGRGPRAPHPRAGVAVPPLDFVSGGAGINPEPREAANQ